MSDAVSQKLSGALKAVWTIQVRHGDEEVRVPRFMPTQWIEGERLNEARLRVLKAAGWHLERLADGQNYLFPNAELAGYALGWASDEYIALFPERAEEAGKAKGGGYYDLTDAILYSEALNVEITLPSGAKLFSPRFPDSWQTDVSVAKNVEMALNGGWVMVSLITEPDLFLLPPEAIAHGAGITLGDAKVGSDTLLALKGDGLISLRGQFAKTSGAFPGLNLPSRVSRGGEWKLEDMIKEQTARWGGVEVKPVVNLADHKWVDRFPELEKWLESHLTYVEELDLARIRWFIVAWGDIPDIGALSNIIGGIKGVMGEVAARERIVDDYRRGRTDRGVLLVAPQIYDRNMFERSDALIVSAGAGGGLTIRKAWEIVTDKSGEGHAQEQMAASLAEYEKGGVILRRPDGRVIQFGGGKVTVSEHAGEIHIVREGSIDATLFEVRETLVMELGLDLVTERVRSKFSPNYDELVEILKEKDGAEKLIELLSVDKEAPECPVVVGRVESDKKISGLKVVSKEEAKRLSRNFFRLVFTHEGENWRLVSAYRRGSSDLAEAWVSGRIDRELDVVERSYLAGLLGTQARSQSAETDLTDDAVAEHLKKHGLTRLLEVAGAIDKSPDREGNMVVVGRVESGKKIFGLKVVSEEEAKRLSRNFFRLVFTREGKNWRLVSAYGNASLNLAVAWVSGRIGRELDVVERSYLAGLLGTRTYSRSEETNLTDDAVAEHLKEHGLTRLLEVAGAIGKTPDWEGNMVVVGVVKSGKKVSGLKVVSEEAAERLSTRSFRLVFTREGENRRPVSASRSGGESLKAKIEASSDAEARGPKPHSASVDRREKGETSFGVMTGADLVVGALEMARRNTPALERVARTPVGAAVRGGITMPIGVAAAQLWERQLEGGWRPHDWREELHAVMVAHPAGLAAGFTTGAAGRIAEAGVLGIAGGRGAAAAIGVRVGGRLIGPAANIFLMSIFADFVVDGRLDITAKEAARSALQMEVVTTATRAPLRAYRVVKAFRHGRRGLALASAAFTDGAGAALALLMEEAAFQAVDLSILTTISWYERQSVCRAFQAELKKEMARFVLMRGGGATFKELRGQASKILTIGGTWKRFEEKTVPFAKLDAEKQLEDSHLDEDSASLQARLSFIQKKRDEIGGRELSCATRWLHPLARRMQLFPNDEAPGIRDELKKFESGALGQLERIIRGKIFKASGDKERAEKEYASARRAIQKAFEKRRRPRPSSLVGIRPTRPGMFLSAQNTGTIFDDLYPFGLKRMVHKLTEDQIIAATPDFSGDPANIFPELERFFLDQSTLAGEEFVALNHY